MFFQYATSDSYSLVDRGLSMQGKSWPLGWKVGFPSLWCFLSDFLHFFSLVRFFNIPTILYALTLAYEIHMKYVCILSPIWNAEQQRRQWRTIRGAMVNHPKYRNAWRQSFYFRPQSADDKNLQVDLLCVRRLGGKSSIGRLLEGEGEDGGDPGVARGTHLEFKLNV